MELCTQRCCVYTKTLKEKKNPKKYGYFYYVGNHILKCGLSEICPNEVKDLFRSEEGFVKKKTATVVNAKECSKCSICPTSSAPGVLAGSAKELSAGEGLPGAPLRQGQSRSWGFLHKEFLEGMRRCCRQPGELGHSTLSRDSNSETGCQQTRSEEENLAS